MIFTPWLNGERTPVDDHTLRGGLAQPVARDRRAPTSCVRCSKASRTTAAGCSERSSSFTGRPFPWLHFIGGGAQSELWCQIMADVLDREIRQVEHPIRANARGAALLAGIALGRIAVDDLARNVRITRAFSPDSANRAVYDDRYTEFRRLHKQTAKRTKRRP